MEALQRTLNLLAEGLRTDPHKIPYRAKSF